MRDLILAGVTVTAFFTAWQTFVQQQNSETLQEVYSWILGNIPSTGWSDVVLILPYIAVAGVVIVALRRVVDVLNLGDDEAASLGVDVKRVRLALVACDSRDCRRRRHPGSSASSGSSSLTRSAF